jgi:hypothetical protein
MCICSLSKGNSVGYESLSLSKFGIAPAASRRLILRLSPIEYFHTPFASYCHEAFGFVLQLANANAMTISKG